MIWKAGCSNSCDHFAQAQLHWKKTPNNNQTKKKPHNQFWRHFCHGFRSEWWAESSGPAVTTNISMNCHHIHLSELCVSEAATREEFPGKLCSSVPLLNLKGKAEEGGCKSPWCCPVRGTSPQNWRLRHSSKQSFLWHSPETDLLCWHILQSKEEKWKAEEDVRREGVHVLAPHHQLGCKGKVWAPWGLPRVTTLPYSFS